VVTITKEVEYPKRNIYISITEHNLKRLEKLMNYLSTTRNNYVLIVMYFLREKPLEEVELYYLLKDIKSKEYTYFYGAFSPTMKKEFEQFDLYQHTVDQYISALLHKHLNQESLEEYMTEFKSETKYRQAPLNEQSNNRIIELSETYSISQTTFLNYALAHDLQSEQTLEDTGKNKVEKQIPIPEIILDKLPKERPEREWLWTSIIDYYDSMQNNFKKS